MSLLSGLKRIHAPEEASPTLDDVFAYDTETSDADVWHGQILQFGGLRADSDLNVLEEIDFRVRRLPYVVPAPSAMTVTRTDPRSLDDGSRMTEYEAAALIESKMKPSGHGNRIFVTFNGIKFDDGIIRTTLFRNLRDPYITSGKACTRIDLLPLAQMVVCGDSDAVAVKRNEEGKISWRLESLCDANGIEIVAHDALGDARATLDLARLIRDRAPWAWNSARIHGNSARTNGALSKAWREKTAVWHFEHYGEPDLAPCAVLGTDEKGKWLLLDLRSGMPAEGVDLSNFEQRLAAGLRIVRSNSAPSFVPAEEVHRYGKQMSAPCADDLAAKAIDDHARASALVAAMSSHVYAEESAPVSTERRLHDGFPPYGDRSRKEAFHRAKDWEARAAIVFEDPRLAEFASRLLAMTAPADDLFGPAPGSPAAAAIERAKDVMKRPFAGVDAPWQTVEGARAEADADWLDYAEGIWPEAFVAAPTP